MDPSTGNDVNRIVPYALVSVGLLGGLLVFLLGPLPVPWLNDLLAAVLLGAAGGAVTYMVVAGSGSGRRGPEF